MSLQKQITVLGSGPEVPNGATVSVHYTGKFLSGQTFDSSIPRGQPFTFQVGHGQVIKGWDQGVVGMKKGEKAFLLCPPEYAYGTRGTPGGPIPPNATLMFEIEVLDWKY